MIIKTIKRKNRTLLWFVIVTLIVLGVIIYLKEICIILGSILIWTAWNL